MEPQEISVWMIWFPSVQWGRMYAGVQGSKGSIAAYFVLFCLFGSKPAQKLPVPNSVFPNWIVLRRRSPVVTSESCAECTSSTCHGVFWSTELLPQLVHIVRVDLFIQSAAKPLGLGMVQHRRHWVRHVYHPPCLRGNHKQEAVRCLQNQMLQFLQEAQQYMSLHSSTHYQRTKDTSEGSVPQRAEIGF